MTSGCCPSDLTPPKGSTGSSAPPPRNARSPSARTCTRPASTRSCPRPSPRPSTGCCTTPTSARPAATASASPRPCPARGEILDLTEPGCSTGRQWADLVATTGPFSMALDRRRPVGRFAGPVDVGRDAATRRRGDAATRRRGEFEASADGLTSNWSTPSRWSRILVTHPAKHVAGVSAQAGREVRLSARVRRASPPWEVDVIERRPFFAPAVTRRKREPLCGRVRVRRRSAHMY